MCVFRGVWRKAVACNFFFWDMTTSRTGRGREYADYHDDLFVNDGDLGEMQYADIAKLSYPSRSCFEAAGRAVFRWERPLPGLL